MPGQLGNVSAVRKNFQSNRRTKTGYEACQLLKVAGPGRSVALSKELHFCTAASVCRGSTFALNLEAMTPIPQKGYEPFHKPRFLSATQNSRRPTSVRSPRSAPVGARLGKGWCRLADGRLAGDQSTRSRAKSPFDHGVDSIHERSPGMEVWRQASSQSLSRLRLRGVVARLSKSATLKCTPADPGTLDAFESARNASA